MKKIKKCIYCGALFEPKNNKQKCCSSECSKKYKVEYNLILQKAKSSMIEDWNSEMQITDERYFGPPTDDDIDNVRVLLCDFGIRDVYIPEFETYKELNNWKNSMIMNS